jgi:hypothetical protein
VRRLTLKEVMEQHGGILPPDAIFRTDDDEESRGLTPPARRPKRRTGRSERFAVLNTFIDVTMASLTGAETKIWLTLFRDTKTATGTARTGQADLARRAGLSVRSVKLALRTLVARGLVRRVCRGRLNVGPSTYTIHPVGPHGAM